MTNLIHPEYTGILYGCTALTIGAIGGLFSRHEAIKIVGLTVLTGAGLQFFTHRIARRDCIEYFATLSEKPTPLNNRLLIMNGNPDLNAAATAIIQVIFSAPIGLFLAAAARAPFSKFTRQISARQLAPWMIASALVPFVIAHLKARAAQKALEDPTLSITERSPHQGVAPKLQPGWEACHVRTNITFFGAALSATLLTIGIIVSRLNFKIA